MKIHIIGSSGSGKTYLSKRLSQKYGIPAYALDDLFWDNDGYSGKRDPDSRNAMLAEILQKNDWIIEGVQYAWVGRSFEEADIIYLLEPPAYLCRMRIVRRFITRKYCGTARKNESLKALMELLKWTKKFYGVNLPKIKDTLAPYQKKVVCVSGKNEVRVILQQQ